MISSQFVRSSVIASFAFVTLCACERSDQQNGAADDTTTPTGTTERQGSPGVGTTGSRDALQGTGTDRTPGTGSATDTTGSDAIERTGGRDMPMGTGGSSASGMGTGGYGGGAGGAAGSTMR